MILGIAAIAAGADAQTITVGSKRFTESYVLGEIAVRLLEDAGHSVVHKQGMGGTLIVWEALKHGDVALYPDYTGTIRDVILKTEARLSHDEMRRALAAHGIGMTGNLGFQNTYAIAMRRETAERLGIRRISDLSRHTDLEIGLTHEFLNRPNDGWRPLSRHYGLRAQPRGMEHALAYVALNDGDIDVMDAYSTDAKLAEYELALLEDDRRFFPGYEAVFLYRLDAPASVVEAIGKLEGTIDEPLMIRLNAEAERTSDYAVAAALYFGEFERDEAVGRAEPLTSKITRWTLQHLKLVGFSMALAVALGVPLGVIASRRGAVGGFILGCTGIIQTIPSIALLALFIPLLGANVTNAIVALFLYSLLPIVRNTTAGIQSIPAPIRESAEALGLGPFAQLVKVFLPMAARTILAGIKTSTIINVGTATIAGFIGAGGYGEVILSGINLNDHKVIMQGAVPAAVLALLAQFFFDFLDRIIIPKGLRVGPTT